MTVLGRAAGCCSGGRGRCRVRATGKDVVVQLTQADQHVLVVEQVVRVGVGVRVAATGVQLLPAGCLLVLLPIVIVTCKYFIKGGINNIRLVLQLLLAGHWTHQGAEQILAIVLVRQLLRGVCRPRTRAWAWQTGQLTGQALCAAAVRQLAAERVCGCWCSRCG